MALTPFMHSAPTETTTAAAIAQMPEGMEDMIILFVETPSASHRFFLDIPHARNLIKNLTEHADQLQHHGLTIAREVPDGIVDPSQTQRRNGS